MTASARVAKRVRRSPAEVVSPEKQFICILQIDSQYAVCCGPKSGSGFERVLTGFPYNGACNAEFKCKMLNKKRYDMSSHNGSQAPNKYLAAISQLATSQMGQQKTPHWV